MSVRSNSKSLFVFLHGSGDTGPEFSAYLDSTTLPKYNFNSFREVLASKNIDLMTPSAPRRMYSATGTYLNVWYDRTADFLREGLQSSEDIGGAYDSLSTIFGRINEVEGNYDHIFFGGFSMGGGLSLYTLSKDLSATKIRGIFAISSFLVESSVVLNQPLGTTTSDLPVLIMHGTDDKMIPFEWGRKTATNLLLLGHEVQFRQYGGVDHDLVEEELQDLVSWAEDIIYKCNNNTSDIVVGGEKAAAVPADSKEDRNVRNGGEKKGQQDSNSNSKRQMKGSDDSGAKFEDDVYDHLTAGTAGQKTVAVSELDMKSLDRALQSEQEEQRQNSSTTATAPSFSVSSSSSVSSSVPKYEGLPYTIELQAATDTATTATTSATSASVSIMSQVTIHYPIAAEYIPILVSRPVFACGAVFEIEQEIDQSGVKVKALSSDPNNTAREVGRRLLIRLQSESDTLNPCVIS